MDPRCLTSFLPRLYLCRDVRWTSEEWKWWYRASRRETWMPPEIEVNPMISGGNVFLHLKEGMVEENPTAFRFVNWVLSSLHVGQLDEDGVEGAGDHHQDWHDKKHCVVPHLLWWWKKYSKKSEFILQVYHMHIITIAKTLFKTIPDTKFVICTPKDGSVVTFLYLISLALAISFVHKRTCLINIVYILPSQTQIK